MSEYKIEGDAVYTRTYPFEGWKLIRQGPGAEQYKTDMEASNALFETGSRDAWRALLKRTFPAAKLCNCGDSFFGCRYGCDSAKAATRNAVAAKILAGSEAAGGQS